jgi:hypothetical protein
MKRKIAVSVALLVAVLAVGGAFYLHISLEKVNAAPAAPRPVPIIASVFVQHDMPIYL